MEIIKRKYSDIVDILDTLRVKLLYISQQTISQEYQLYHSNDILKQRISQEYHENITQNQHNTL